MAKRDDLTLDEALSDPMILAVLRADGADPQALRRDWQPLVERFTAGAGRDDDREGERGRLAAAWLGLLDDCLCAARARDSARADGRSVM